MNPLIFPAILLILSTFRYLKYFDIHGRWVTAITILFQQITVMTFERYCGINTTIAALIIVSGAIGIIHDASSRELSLGAFQVFICGCLMALTVTCDGGVPVSIIIAICGALNTIQIQFQ